MLSQKPMKSNRENLPVHDFIDYSEAEGIPFGVYEFGQLSPNAQASFPHRHLFYAIQHIKGGEGTHIIDFEPYSIEPNSLYFISPSQTHFWQSSSPLDGSVVVFNEDFILASPSEQGLIYELDFFHRVVGSPHLVLSRDQGRSINQIIRHMEKEYRSNAYGRILTLRSYLRILLIRIQRMFETDRVKNNSVKRSPLVNNFKKMVSEYFLTQRSISSYADELGVSEAHLYDIVNKIAGVTPGQIIRNEISLEAKRQLAHTDLTIAEICYKLNFEDPSYFGRFFKREIGMSPKSFRLHIREKYHNFQV